MSKLLINEPPLMVLPKLARLIGLNEAIVIQQIHFWITHYQEKNDRHHYQGGRWWVWNTLEEWQANFPFWSAKTIQRALTTLRTPTTENERGPLVLTGNYNRKGYDKTLWYTIDYTELDKLDELLKVMSISSGQNVQMEKDKMSTPIPENTPKITKKERENKDIEEFESFERHPASAFKEENPEAIAVPTKKSSAVEEVARQLAPAIDWVWGSSDASDKKLLHAAEELLKACGGDVDGTLDALDAYLSNPKNREWAKEDVTDPHWLIKSVAGQYQKVMGQAHRKSTARAASSAHAERSQEYREATPEPEEEDLRWDAALKVLREGMDGGTHHHLFRDSYLVSLDPAVLEVRDEGVKEMLELRWTERVAEALGVARVTFEVMKGANDDQTQE